MKTIVVYFTKHGSSRNLAQQIAKRLACESIDVGDLKELDADQILFISATYMGMIHKQIKEWIMRLPDDKRIGFLKVGLGSDDVEKVLEENLHEYKHKISFYRAAGGCVQPDKLNFFEKIIFKIVNHQAKLIQPGDKQRVYSFLNESEIEAFIKDAAQ